MADTTPPAKKKPRKRGRKSTIAMLLGAGKTDGQHPTRGGLFVDGFAAGATKVPPGTPRFYGNQQTRR